MRTFTDKYGSYRVLQPDLVRLYAETFGESDMREAIRFHQSDFGKRFLGGMPEPIEKVPPQTRQNGDR